MKKFVKVYIRGRGRGAKGATFEAKNGGEMEEVLR